MARKLLSLLAYTVAIATLVSTGRATAEEPSFIDSPEYLKTSMADQNVSFTCRVSGEPQPTITWSFQDNDVTVSDAPKLQVFENGDLFIEAVNEDDEGVYTCTARNEHGEASASGELTVTTPTEITLPPESLSVWEGQEVKFTCAAVGDPDEVLRIHWLWNSVPIDELDNDFIFNKEDNDSLSILNAKQEDSGTLTCVASNWLDTATANAGLNVKKPSGPPTLVKQPSESIIFFARGEVIVLPCEASGTPTPTYYWVLNGREQQRSRNIGTLTLVDTNERTAADYQCFAKNIFGTAVSDKISIRMAFLESFLQSQPQPFYPRVGEPWTLRCIPPHSNPPAVVFWGLGRNGQSLRALELSNRVVMDPEGNLHFLEITQEDAQDGQGYFCVATNAVARRMKQSRPSYLRVQPSQQIVRSAPTIVWQSPTHQTALVGHEWRIMCIFSGSPVPEVTWARRENGADVDLPPNARTDNHGMELVVSSVQPENAGSYECQGLNDMTQVPLRRSFNLRVQAAPSWVAKPADFLFSKGESSQIVCQASGVPDPIIYWYYNGEPITESSEVNRQVFRVNGATLDVVNPSDQDMGVFQCNATNKHGYVFENVAVHPRIDIPALIFERLPSLQFAAEGQSNVTLKCEVGGSPRPNVTWYKDDIEIPAESNDVVFLEEGSLVIREVTYDDSGLYTCRATNQFGSVEASGSFNVTQPTRIIVPPRNTTVVEGSEVKLECTATTDPSHQENLRIKWFARDEEIQFDYCIRCFIDPMDGSSLVIVGTNTLDTRPYTCVASNGIDQDEATATLVVKGVPDPPSQVQVTCNYVGPETATINFREPRDGNSPILRYTILYNTSFSPDVWKEATSVVPTGETQFVGSLSPYGNYSFAVVAWNSIGPSEPSAPWEPPSFCRTRPARPEFNPRNVMAQGDQPDNLIIYWDAMTPEERNGRGFRYVVTWQRADEDDAIQSVMRVADPNAWYFVVPEAVPTYVPFSVSVRADNELGEAVIPANFVIGYSGEGEPTVAPENLRIDEESPNEHGTQAVVYWDPVDPDALRAFLRGYRLEYGAQNGWPQRTRTHDVILHEGGYPPPRDVLRGKRSLPDGVVSATLSNLPANTAVDVTVRVLTRYYAGPASDRLTFSTPEGVPGPPSALRVSQYGLDFLELEWQTPLEPNGDVTGYVISLQQVTGRTLERLVATGTTKAKQKTFKVKRLASGSTYRLHVAAKTAVGTGESTFIQARTLDEQGEGDGGSHEP